MEKSYTFWYPEGLNPRDALPPHLLNRWEYVLYLLNTIRHQLEIHSEDGLSFVPLKREYLTKIFPSSPVVDEICNALIYNGIIEKRQSYVVGKISKGFRITEKYANRPYVPYRATNKFLIKSLGKVPQLDNVYTPDKIHRHLFKMLNKTEIKIRDALEYVRSTPRDFLSLDEQILNKINTKDWYFRPCEYGRCHSNLTNMPGDCRKFLHVKGQPLANVDIRNSQPFFFVLLLLDKAALFTKTHRKVSGEITDYIGAGDGLLQSSRVFLESGLPEDVVAYIDLVQRGQLYEFAMDVFSVPPDERSIFKKQFFGGVFFCKPRPQYKMSKIFEGIFPNVYNVINEYKKPNFENLAWTLQKRESDLMIGKVARWIMKECPNMWFSTIHDSILTFPANVELVKNAILMHFIQNGLTPTINMEYY
jgi:hypothetical protein